MNRWFECPHCASADLEVVPVEFEARPALAVRCKECGALGPPSHGDDPKHAVFAWNRRPRLIPVGAPSVQITAKSIRVRSSAAGALVLNRRTLYGTEQAKDTAVTGLRAQHCPAVRAFVEK